MNGGWGQFPEGCRSQRRQVSDCAGPRRVWRHQRLHPRRAGVRQGASKTRAITAIRRTSPPTLKRIRDEVGGGREGHDVQRLTRVSTPKVTIVGPAALIGGQTSRRKAASSRANGRLGAGRVVRRRTAKR